MYNIKKKFIWIGAVAILLFGISIGSTTGRQAALAETKVVERIIEKPVIKEVVKNETEWKELKELDDEALAICSEGFGTVADIFEAQSKLDLSKIEAHNEALVEKAGQMNDIGKERRQILEKLGY